MVSALKTLCVRKSENWFMDFDAINGTSCL